MTRVAVTPRPRPLDGATSTVHHWVPKADILRSMVDDVEVTALCGDRAVYHSDRYTSGLGGSPNICPACNDIYRTLRD